MGPREEEGKREALRMLGTWSGKKWRRRKKKLAFAEGVCGAH